MATIINGRKIITRYNPVPGPSVEYDWSAIDDNYDGGDPIGFGATEQAAIDDLLDQFEDQTNDGHEPFPSSAWHGG
jgi:hypothetical protein